MADLILSAMLVVGVVVVALIVLQIRVRNREIAEQLGQLKLFVAVMKVEKLETDVARDPRIDLLNEFLMSIDMEAVVTALIPVLKPAEMAGFQKLLQTCVDGAVADEQKVV